MMFLQIKLDILSVTTLLQLFLLLNCGYLRLVNGSTTESTFTEPSTIEKNTTSLDNVTVTSLDTTPMTGNNMASSEISPSPTIADITSISEPIDTSKNTNANSSDIFTSYVSLAPSETSSIEMVTESSVINSFSSVSVPWTPALNTGLINQTSSLSDFFSGTSVVSDMSSEWLSTSLMSSSMEILPTSAITTDFATVVDTDTTANDIYQYTSENITTALPTTELPTTELPTTEKSNTTHMYLPENITTTFAMATDANTTTTDMSQPTNITSHFATTVEANMTASNDNQSTTLTTNKNLTLKPSMSKSSKIAAGICIPLAILAILGITYIFYKRRYKDRSINFSEKGSTWSYSNASFTDDAIKTSAQQS